MLTRQEQSLERCLEDSTVDKLESLTNTEIENPCDFYQNGLLNIAKYMQSNAFREQERCANQRVLDRVIDDINSSINRVVAGISTVDITQEAYQKTHKIVNIFSDLTNCVEDRTAYELALFSLSKGDGIIDDIYIPHRQTVQTDFCPFDGLANILANDYATKNGRQLHGQVHSHGENTVFLSPRDRRSLKSMIRLDWGETKPIEYNGLSIDNLIHYLPVMVTNTKNECYFGIQLKVRKYKKAKPGEIVRFDEQYPLLEQGTHGIRLNLTNKTHGIIMDEESIKKRLLYGDGNGGVTLKRNGQEVLLSKLYEKAITEKDEQSQEADKTLTDRLAETLKSAEKPETFTQKVQDSKPWYMSQGPRVKPQDATKPEPNLAERVSVLEEHYKRICSDYKKMYMDYNTLLTENKQIKLDIAKLYSENSARKREHTSIRQLYEQVKKGVDNVSKHCETIKGAYDKLHERIATLGVLETRSFSGVKKFFRTMAECFDETLDSAKNYKNRIPLE